MKFTEFSYTVNLPHNIIQSVHVQVPDPFLAVEARGLEMIVHGHKIND